MTRSHKRKQKQNKSQTTYVERPFFRRRAAANGLYGGRPQQHTHSGNKDTHTRTKSSQPRVHEKEGRKGKHHARTSLCMINSCHTENPTCYRSSYPHTHGRGNNWNNSSSNCSNAVQVTKAARNKKRQQHDQKAKKRTSYTYLWPPFTPPSSTSQLTLCRHPPLHACY